MKFIFLIQDMQFTHHVKQKKFNEDIIVATSLVLLMAGYDTTGIMKA